ncbi:hypothetical protein NL53_09125 [Vibrio variabilis]|uniref:TadE-like domain-containing protein n=1 Tax=Vibrio variabilis TaxID=990271 RepID=A0ABR4YBD1_9VIBR|nr:MULTISPECIES: TadE family protein [Vibrio]KHA60773.1 hypothetical protein NL53_09125 [Vibrio variabilis]KIE21127.1 hypothetical protein SE23_08730 [Vibrio sinaloensis]
MTLRAHRQTGTISIETALLMPVILGIVLVFFDISRLHLQYSLLDHAMRHSLRELLTEDWTSNPLSSGKIKTELEKHSFDMLDSVNVEVTRFNSLSSLLQADKEEGEVNSIYRPADPVYRVRATLTTSMKFSPIGFFDPEPLKYSSTLIISQD